MCAGVKVVQSIRRKNRKGQFVFLRSVDFSTISCFHLYFRKLGDSISGTF